ncbi:YciI family protein [Glutamicibacter sp. TV12E]|uniref:YciI family protein n=1 Tax=Glutamicibacter sp. TV12E TaxID=3446362 RepID=UPI0040338325
MTVFAVEYVYAEDSVELRNEHRPAHREYLVGFVNEGPARVLASGPTPATDGALLIIAAESEAALNELLANDPFNKVGAIAQANISEWNPVIGLLQEFSA